MEAVRAAMYAEHLAPALIDARETAALDIPHGVPHATVAKVVAAKVQAADRVKALRRVLWMDDDG